jgi:hypothetical protein
VAKGVAGSAAHLIIACHYRGRLRFRRHPTCHAWLLLLLLPCTVGACACRARHAVHLA